MCGNKDGDGRHHRGSPPDPVEGEAFQLSQVCCTRLQRDGEHQQVPEIRKEVVEKKQVVREFEKVNHDREPATAAETFSCDGWGSGGKFQVRSTSSKIVFVRFLIFLLALISLSSLVCKPAFSSAVR